MIDKNGREGASLNYKETNKEKKEGRMRWFCRREDFEEND
jgi:hypothetical protein